MNAVFPRGQGRGAGVRAPWDFVGKRTSIALGRVRGSSVVAAAGPDRLTTPKLYFPVSFGFYGGGGNVGSFFSIFRVRS